MQFAFTVASSLEDAALRVDPQDGRCACDETGFRNFFDRELQPGNVLGGRARRLAQRFAHNARPIDEFPGWADKMAADCLSSIQQGCDRFAESPVQGACSIFCAYVNLRSRRLELRYGDAGF